MSIFQESCCSFLAVLLVFLLQGSRADDPGVPVHKAVGGSLDLIADYPKTDLEVKWKYNWIEFAEYEKDQFNLLDPPLFHKRIKMNKDNISITVEDLTLQDSGFFSILAVGRSGQYPTKVIVLRVHDLIRDVQIKLNHSWIESKNICRFHLLCQASGDPNPSYSWSGDPVTTGPNLSINLHLAESATVNCTANNTVSAEHTIKTVECRGKSEGSRFCVKMLNS